MSKKKTQDLQKSIRPNSYYHIYNRGNHKKTIFHSQNDYDVFLNLLLKYLNIYDPIQLISYCLMPNHYHLLLQTSSQADELTKLMHRFMTSYVIYFNRRYQQRGRLFESPYKRKYLPREHDIKRTVNYIKNNPTKAALCRRSEDYKWLWCSDLYFLTFENKVAKQEMELSKF